MSQQYYSSVGKASLSVPETFCLNQPVLYGSHGTFQQYIPGPFGGQFPGFYPHPWVQINATPPVLRTPIALGQTTGQTLMSMPMPYLPVQNFGLGVSSLDNMPIRGSMPKPDLQTGNTNTMGNFVHWTPGHRFSATQLKVPEVGNNMTTCIPPQSALLNKLPKPDAKISEAMKKECIQESLEKILGLKKSAWKKQATLSFCKFCKGNKELRSFYTNHNLRNGSGIVQCPVLRSYVCPICSATGDFAHTQKYCPSNKDTSITQNPLLYTSKVNSTGKRTLLRYI